MKRLAKGRAGRKPPGTPNGLESQYMAYLSEQRLAGEIAWWTFERYTFTLVHSVTGGMNGLRYTPDFAVMRPDGTLEFHEVKGFRDEKNMNKLKQAAEMFPHRFVLVEKQTKKQGGGWHTTVYEA